MDIATAQTAGQVATQITALEQFMPFGPANQPNSALALQTALSTYQAQLAALQTQLAGL